MFITTMAVLSIVFMVLIVLTGIFGLPGGVISLIIPLIWAVSGHIEWSIFIWCSVLAASGEAADFFAGYFLSKRKGISSASFWVSMIFAIVVGALMAPLFLGIGAVIGTFIGAYIGSFLYEIFTGAGMQTALDRSKSALTGRFLGVVMKLTLGIAAVVLTAQALF